MNIRFSGQRRLAAFLSCFAALVVWLGLGSAEAARISDVRGTKHNLSAAADGSTYTRPGGGTGTVPGTGTIPGTDLMPRNIKASSETQICVFCHTPHAATSGATPLWNRKVAGQGYTQAYNVYDSSTLDAKSVQGSLNQPGGSSKLCLSCHDGTMAIGSVNVLNGQGGTPGAVSISMTGGPNMPTGAGVTTGFTRNLGVDLSNDHPISVSYTADLASRDGEMRVPDNVLIGARSADVKPKLPLEPTGPTGFQDQLQCAACHDPHQMETEAGTVGNQKFLRLNRFQGKNPPSPSGFDAATETASAAQGDIICLACHDKNNGTGAWAYSAHANPAVADELYGSTAADRREFPRNLPVWKAACLNCHDTHTVPGARRLLREGTDSASTPKSGGSPALEETCYQCHDGGGNGTLQAYTQVPNIKSDFGLARRMPIRSLDQAAGSETHDISAKFTDAYNNCDTATSKCGKDFLEPRDKLGVGNLNNRHAECTDCHNPHRVVKFKDFRGNPAGTLSGTPDASGTHAHTDDSAAIHTNIASGVLRGSWGVEPTYTSSSFHDLPSGYTVKRGDPGASTDTSAAATYVTREYQICLKCHSDYGYSDDNVYPNSGNRPQLGGAGTTPANSNGHSNFTSYTNQAKEFQAPAGHAVAVGSVSLGQNGGTAAAYNANNHRSWHPVMAPTGRTGRAGSWRAPWNNSGTGGKAGRLGTQTMYCSDCHGSGVAAASYSVVPTGGENGSPWGPHGSDNNFLLKGVWNTATGEGQETTGLCFKCHNYSAYAGGGGGTGFQTTDRGDGHAYHADKIDTAMKCNFCHVAVPHGWKNRNLLVNLNDVGPEAGLPAGTAVWQSSMNNSGGGYSSGPYYRHAYLRINSFPSGKWSDSNCNGGKDGMRTNCETPN